MKVSRKIDGCFEGGLRVFQGSFKGVSRMFYVFLRKFLMCFKGVLRAF